MGMTAEQYQAQLDALLPPGAFWRWVQGSVLYGLLLAIGDSLARVDAVAERLPLDADPRTTSDPTNWEACCGLPDGCIPGGGTLQQRRNAVVSRLASVGGASAAYIEALAAEYGYTVTVEDLGPSHWRVNAAEADVVVNSTCNGTCDDPLEVFGNEQLECLITRVKQSHTQVEFAYGV